jgi:hypothetical protein
MAVETTSVKLLASAELEDRRLAVENAIGTLRIEGMELDAIPQSILEQYANGQIPLDEMSRLIHEYTASIV